MPQQETTAVHAGEASPRIQGAVAMPVFQTAMYEYDGTRPEEEVRYIRYSNTPNHEVLHGKLAALEETETALVTGSGMAAISAALLSVLKSGDHLLIQPGLYGGTYSFLKNELPDLGITFDVLPDDTTQWQTAVRPNTRALYAETITNPLMQVPDLEGLTTFAQTHGLATLIDNTFATPINFRPSTIGFDLVLHSATKHLNGHSDVMAGAVMGSKKRLQKVERKLRHLGGSLDPHAASLLHRGLKTLALRVKQQNRTALQLARFFDKHPAVEKVYYPGLKSHPAHARAKDLFDNFGTMISFELQGGVPAARQLFERLTLPIAAPSLGGVESLITRPALTSHSSMPPKERKALGITDSLIRVSAGIEAAEDLVDDFKQALDG